MNAAEVSAAYLDALLERNSYHARRVVEEALDGGMPVSEVYLGVLQPALYELGRRWADGTVNVAFEHYGSAVTERLLGVLAERLRTPPAGGRLAVVACTPDELHALGARMVADFLESDGWEVVHLGATTPPDDLAALAADEGADVVVLSTAMVERADGARAAVRALAALDPRPLIVIGGQAWRECEPPDEADLVVRGDADELVAALRDKFAS